MAGSRIASLLAPGQRLQALLARLGLLRRSERAYLILVPAVGLSTGLVAVLLDAVLRGLTVVFWGSESIPLSPQGSMGLRLGAPLAGGAVVGLLTLLARDKLAGEGSTDLLEAVALRGGRIETRSTLLGQGAAVVTIASGGSAGRDGPLLQSGALIASWLARAASLGGNRLKILLGCGAAAGIAATFNAPVGGALFAMEVILGNFALDTFGPVVIASVLATLVTRATLFPGGTAPFAIPEVALASAPETVLFAFVGILAGVLAAVLIAAIGGAERLFRLLSLPRALAPILGLGAVGLLGLLAPAALGNGFATIEGALHGDFEPGLLALVVLVKIAATALTRGSGGAGGLLTPALVVGAAAGGVAGIEVQSLFPALARPAAAYALVGMGSLAAAATHAPLSAILILFEMSQSYALILPLMIACIAADLTRRLIERESIFTAPLAARGLELPHRLGEMVLEGMTARDLVREDAETLRPNQPVPAILERFMDSRRNHLYVVDGEGRFRGAVSIHDLKPVLQVSANLDFILAADVLHEDFPAVFLDDRLTRVLEVFAGHDWERVPVLRDAESRRFQGLLSKRDLISVYNQEVLQRPSFLARFTPAPGAPGTPAEETTFVELPPDYRLALLPVGAGLAGRTLAEIDLPGRHAAQVLELKRRDATLEEHRLLPRGATRLERGDRLVLLAPTAELAELERRSQGAG